MFENKYFDDIINNLTGNNLKMKKILLNIIKKTINGNEISETLIDIIKSEIIYNKNFSFKKSYDKIIKYLNSKTNSDKTYTFKNEDNTFKSNIKFKNNEEQNKKIY